MKINEITRDEWIVMSDEERQEYRSKENMSAQEQYAKQQETVANRKRKPHINKQSGR